MPVASFPLHQLATYCLNGRTMAKAAATGRSCCRFRQNILATERIVTVEIRSLGFLLKLNFPFPMNGIFKVIKFVRFSRPFIQHLECFSTFQWQYLKPSSVANYSTTMRARRNWFRWREGFHHFNGGEWNEWNVFVTEIFFPSPQRPASHFDTWDKDPFINGYFSHLNICVELTFHFIQFRNMSLICGGNVTDPKAVGFDCPIPAILAGSIRERKQKHVTSGRSGWIVCGVCQVGDKTPIHWAALTVRPKWQDKPMTLTDQSDRHLLTQKEQHKRNQVLCVRHAIGGFISRWIDVPCPWITLRLPMIEFRSLSTVLCSVQSHSAT